MKHPVISYLCRRWTNPALIVLILACGPVIAAEPTFDLRTLHQLPRPRQIPS